MCVHSYAFLAQKALFLPPLCIFITTWIKVEPHCVEAQGPPLSAKVSFVRIDPADVKLPGNNQSVSNAVFKVTRII